VPRPRTVPDDDVLAAAARAIARSGPAGVTLAEVGREAGLSAPTLVQRFGSRRGLLLAVAAHGAGAVEAAFAAARAAHPGDPLGALVAATTHAFAGAGRAEMANHIAFLALDVGDEDFRALAAAHAASTRAEIAALLQAAVGAGALDPAADRAAVARALQVAANGSVVLWAMAGDGPLEDAVRTDLAAVLAPHRLQEVRA
jgi:AcrR family transcriptional regulator